MLSFWFWGVCSGRRDGAHDYGWGFVYRAADGVGLLLLHLLLLILLLLLLLLLLCRGQHIVSAEVYTHLVCGESMCLYTW